MENQTPSLITDEMSLSIIDAVSEIVHVSGAEKLTVRMILQKMGISNRVFYNRFHNVDEVLDIVYKNTVLKVRESMEQGFDPNGDFRTQALNIVTATLELSYKIKMNFNTYVFETDSHKSENYAWWKEQIIRILECGKKSGDIKADLDCPTMAYAIWCFIRGYNSDCLLRGRNLENAAEDFRYCFAILLDGMKP